MSAEEHDDIFDSRYSWTRLGVTLAAGSAGSVGIWSFIAVLPAVQAEFGLSRGEASAPYVVSMIGFAAGSVIVGKAIDRFGVARCVAASAVMLALSYFLAAHVSGLGALTALHLLIGFGSSACFAPLMADISHWFMKRRGFAVTVAASGNYLAGALWPWLLSGVLAEDGWRAVYLWFGVIVAVIVLPLSLALRPRPPVNAMAIAGRKASRAVMSAGLSPRAVQLLLCLAGIGCCVAMSMPQVHIVAYCVDLGYGPAVGSEMLSLMLLGGVASRLVSGLMADRFGGVKTLLAGSALQCLALMLYIPFSSQSSLYLVSMVFGLSQGGLVPAYAIIVREYLPPAEAGARVGSVIMSTIVGMALGGWLSGVIYDWSGSYTLAFINGVAWNGLNIVVVAGLLLRSRPRAPAMA